MSRLSLARIQGLAVLALLALGCAEQQASERLLVLCAASMAPTIEELGTTFELRRGVDVRVSSGGSNALAQQVLHGADAALFVSAHREWADAVAARFPEAVRCVLASNELALIVPAGNPGGVARLSDLATDRIRRVALAGENVPAGAYADRALAAAGLASTLATKIVRGHSVRVALGFVERGEVDAGIVYASDVRLSNAVALVESIDASSHPRIEYHLLLLSPEPDARALYDELIGPAAANLLAERGFLPIDR